MSSCLSWYPMDDVLIHCLEGQDRTGILGLCLLRYFNPNLTFNDVKEKMAMARPAREIYWFRAPGFMSETGEYYRYSTRVLDQFESD